MGPVVEFRVLGSQSGECVGSSSGRLAVARSVIRQWQQQQQHSSEKLLSWPVVYLGYSVPLPWCTKVVYRVRYVVSVLFTVAEGTLPQTCDLWVKALLDPHLTTHKLFCFPWIPKQPGQLYTLTKLEYFWVYSSCLCSGRWCLKQNVFSATAYSRNVKACCVVCTLRWLGHSVKDWVKNEFLRIFFRKYGCKPSLCWSQQAGIQFCTQVVPLHPKYLNSPDISKSMEITLQSLRCSSDRLIQKSLNLKDFCSFLVRIKRDPPVNDTMPLVQCPLTKGDWDFFSCPSTNGHWAQRRMPWCEQHNAERLV